MIFKFNSLSELIAAFPDEQTCIEYLEHNLWHGNVISKSGNKITYKELIYAISKN